MSLKTGDLVLLCSVQRDWQGRRIFLYNEPRGAWCSEGTEDWKISGEIRSGEFACILQSVTFEGQITEICEVEILTAKGQRGWCWGDMLRKVKDETVQ